jgi:hypothetical protein
MNKYVSVEELLEMVASMQSDLRLYNEDSWSKLSAARLLPAHKDVNIKDEAPTLMEAIT